MNLFNTIVLLVFANNPIHSVHLRRPSSGNDDLEFIVNLLQKDRSAIRFWSIR